MGLDMYLTAKLHLGKYTNYPNAIEKQEQIRKQFPEMFKSDNLDTVEISFEAGYWRKANAIHKFFIDNCADGDNDCTKMYVSRETLKLLLILCEMVLNERTQEIAEEKLPTMSGFFFGSTDYDEYYYEDLKNTITIIKKCLELPEEWDFEYIASW